MKALRTITLIAAVASVGACGESTTAPTEDTREILTDPSFAVNINEIIQRRGCSASACHGNAAGGMTLTASAAANYAAWVDVPALAESFLRVEPGNADDSYVIIKVEGRQSVGQQMPRNAAPLDNIDLTNLRNWINNGAPNN